MKEYFLNQRFLTTLNEIIPTKLLLVNEISRILNMERKTVYRRLSGEVPFTLDETGILASYFHLSIDNILFTDRMNRSCFYLESPILSSINELTEESLNLYTKKLTDIVTCSESEMGIYLNSIPRFLFCQYKHIVQLLLFKWGYYNNRDAFGSFCNTEVPDYIMRYYVNMNELCKRVKNTFYIWNESIIYNLVLDIQYFLSINKISAENVKLIKDELFHSLEMLENLAKDGEFEENGNKFEFYTSPLDFGPTRLFLITENFCQTVCFVNLVQRLSSYETEMAEIARTGIKAIRSSSIRISQSAEKKRILFFKEQREAIDRL